MDQAGLELSVFCFNLLSTGIDTCESPHTQLIAIKERERV